MKIQIIEIRTGSIGLKKKISVIQEDTARQLRCILSDFIIPDGSAARIYAIKPSGNKIYNDGVIEGNTVLVDLTTQLIAEIGEVACQVEITESNGNVLTSFEFAIDVKKRLKDASAIESTNEYKALESALEKTQGLDARINSEVSERKSEYAVLSARMDTFTALEEGSTTGDAELIDIRVKADGTTATSAGSAVREQFGELKSDIDKKITTGRQLFDYETAEHGYFYDYRNGGTRRENANWCNQKIYIDSNTNFSVNKNCIISFYGNDGTFINGILHDINGHGNYTTPSNVGYLMFSVSIVNAPSIMLQLGELSTEYENFCYKFTKSNYKEIVGGAVDRIEVIVNGETKLYDVLNKYRGIRNVTIYVNKDIDIIEELGQDFCDNYTSSDIEGYLIGSGIHLIFASGVKVLCNYTGNNQTFITRFSPFSADKGNLFDGFTLTNAHIIASRVRYCVHDELYNRNGACRHIYENCIFELDNRNAGKTDVYCVGCGSGLNSSYVFEKCVFKAIADDTYSDRQYGLLWHTSVDGDGECNLAITNNYFHDGLCLSTGGSGTVSTTALVNGNRFGKSIVKKLNDGGYTNDTITLLEYGNVIEN